MKGGPLDCDSLQLVQPRLCWHVQSNTQTKKHQFETRLSRAHTLHIVHLSRHIVLLSLEQISPVKKKTNIPNTSTWAHPPPCHKTRTEWNLKRFSQKCFHGQGVFCRNVSDFVPFSDFNQIPRGNVLRSSTLRWVTSGTYAELDTDRLYDEGGQQENVSHWAASCNWWDKQHRFLAWYFGLSILLHQSTVALLGINEWPGRKWDWSDSQWTSPCLLTVLDTGYTVLFTCITSPASLPLSVKLQCHRSDPAFSCFGPLVLHGQVELR